MLFTLKNSSPKNANLLAPQTIQDVDDFVASVV